MKKIRANKKPLTEGAGAGYKFEGNLSIDKVNKIKSIKPMKQTSNGITWTYAEIELDADASFEGTVASYDYDGYLDDIEMKITKIIVNANFLDYDMEPGSDYTDITVEDLETAFSYGYLHVKSKTIGAGFTFTKFDGKIEFKDAESDFSGGEIDKIECVITDDKVISYVNKAVRGETHHEEYYIVVDGKQISNGAFADYEDAMDRVATVLLPDGDNHVVVYFKSWDDTPIGDTEEYEEEVVWDSEENTLEESVKENKSPKEKWKPLGYAYKYTVDVDGLTDETFEDEDEAVEYAKELLEDDDSIDIDIIKVTYEINNDGSQDEVDQDYIYTTDDLLESIKIKTNKSLKENKVQERYTIPTNPKLHHKHDGTLNETDTIYTITVFKTKGEIGHSIIMSNADDVYDEVFFNTPEEAKEFVTSTYADAWKVIIREETEYDKKLGDTRISKPFLERENGEWHNLATNLKESKGNTMKLTVDDILKLRKEIELNSLYIKDYTNTLGIDPNWVLNFFDGYIDYLVELSEEQNVIDFLDLDTEENLRAYIDSIDLSSLTAPIEEACQECKTESCETTEDKQVVEDIEVKVPTETTTDSPVETTKEDTDTGIASLLNTAIRDEWKTIDLYNSFIATFKDLEKYKELSVEKKEQLSNIITDILHEELKHVGQLQSALDLVNQPVDNIAKGEEEGKEQAEDISLIKSDTEEVQPTTETKDIEITDKPVELDTASDLNEDDIEVLASYFGTED